LIPSKPPDGCFIGSFRDFCPGAVGYAASTLSISCGDGREKLGVERGMTVMKISIEIDCTPIEARQFLGLPNVEPMQAVMLAKLEKRMSEEIDRFSPETLMKSWVGLFPQNAEWAQKMFESFISASTKAERK
jgi:hypothetical protein